MCEDRLAEMNCLNGGLIIKVVDVRVLNKNAKYCKNNATAPMCVVSETEEKYLKCGLGKVCDGKTECNVHMAHGVYNNINLPCRDLGILVRMVILFDCRHRKLHVVVNNTLD